MTASRARQMKWFPNRANWETLGTVIQALAENPSHESVGSAIIAAAPRALGVTETLLWILSPTKDRLTLAKASGTGHAAPIARKSLPLTSLAAATEAVRTGRPQELADLRQGRGELAELRLLPSQSRHQSLLALPLPVQGHVLGVLEFLWPTPYRPTATQTRLAQALADLLASAIAAEQRQAATTRAEHSAEIAHRLSATQYAVMHLVTEAASLEAVAPKLLPLIAENLHWEWGAIWLPGPQATTLHCRQIWHQSSPALASFDALTSHLSLAPGSGLPGRVWATGQPLWIPEVSKAANFPRWRAAATDGLHSAFGFPILGHSEVLGVLEFVSCEPREPNPALLNAMALVGREIGQLIERKQTESERARLIGDLADERAWLRTVIENSPVGILLVEGAKGEQTIVNRQAERLFGHAISAAGGIAQLKGQVLYPDGTPIATPDLAVTRALAGQTVTREAQILRQPDGQMVWVLVSAVPIRQDRQITGAVIVYEDITRIRELERLREEWTSIVAHDLRQPVTIITGYAGLLRHLLASSGQERVQQAVGHVLSAAWNLNKMIGDLLDISRIETNRLELRFESVDLPTLISEVVERLAPITRDHPVRVEVSGEIPNVWADPARIEQILGNLISNAVKYGYPASEIQVRIGLLDGVAAVSVTNHGPGIASTEIPHLFDRFQRTPEARNGKTKGLGLGLYISRGIVTAHHGRIWVESTPNRETTFTFTLPLAPAPD